jgi:hypothetical protein
LTRRSPISPISLHARRLSGGWWRQGLAGTNDPKIAWMSALPPVTFGLTTEGELTVEWSVQFGTLDSPHVRMGLVVPAEEARTLLLHLKTLETMQETLTAKRPTPGAH